MHLLDNAPNQPSKFRTKNWVKINDDSRRTNRTNSQIKFKTSRLKSSLCDYSDAYILVSGTITVSNTGTAAVPNNRKNIIIKNCASFTVCISEINSTQIDNAKEIDVAMPIHNLIEYSDNYSKTSGILWQYYKDELVLDDNGAITNFPANNDNSASFKLKQKEQTEQEMMAQKTLK